MSAQVLEQPQTTAAESEALAGPKGRLRSMRWPCAQKIRAVAEALERGDSLALAGRRLAYVTEFFGLPTPPRPADATPRQWAARNNWARRRETFGKSGFSAEGTLALRLNLVQAAIVKARTPKRSHCRRGHKWTVENTRQTPKGRSCRACEVVVRAEKNRRRSEWLDRKAAIAEARQQMLEVGRRSDMDPASKYWRDRYVAARGRWQKLKQAAA